MAIRVIICLDLSHYYSAFEVSVHFCKHLYQRINSYAASSQTVHLCHFTGGVTLAWIHDIKNLTRAFFIDQALRHDYHPKGHHIISTRSLIGETEPNNVGSHKLVQ